MTTENIFEDKNLWADGFETRDGDRVVVLDDESTGDYPVTVKIYRGARVMTYTCTLSGERLLGHANHPYDIIRKPVKHKITSVVNIYEKNNGFRACFHDDERSASGVRRCDCYAVKTIEIEFTEGEGLS
jgi:hypothetical protein